MKVNTFVCFEISPSFAMQFEDRDFWQVELTTVAYQQ